MGKHQEIPEATRRDVRDDWVVTRCISTTAKKFGITNEAVKQVIADAAVFSALPETIKSDIHAEVRRLQIAMDVLWPRVLAGELKAIDRWRKLGVDLRVLTGWQAPASSGFHLSVNVAQVTTGSAKLEELLNSLTALPAPPEADNGSIQTGHFAETGALQNGNCPAETRPDRSK
jgi:hypothetical protein